jgi:hypothetical protein
MDKTLNELPEEGKTFVSVQRQYRQECGACGEYAHYKHTWLLKGTRSNPESEAYGRDDCSWCEDDCTFACPECTSKIRPPEGYVTCSIFPASARFAHMFLYKHQVDLGDAVNNELQAILDKATD